jgi:hypothetical protein
MERIDVLELMSTLKLYGMRAAYDEVMATGIKRRHEPPRIVGDLLSAEIAEKQARSIKYQLTIAKLPLAKDIDDFDFAGTPVNQALIRDLASAAFLTEQRNAVLVGGTGTGKSHLALLSISSIGWRAKLAPPARTARRLSDPAQLRRPRRTRLSAVRSDWRPAALPSDQPALRTHLYHCHYQYRLRRLAERIRRREDDDRAARSLDPSLRNRRDRQRVLALQKPRLSATPACPDGQTGSSRAPLRRGVTPLRAGALLFATGTRLSQRQRGVPIGRR